MRHSDRISGLFLLVFGLFVLLHSLRTLPLGTPYEPEAGLFPFLIGIVMTGLALAMVIQAFREKVQKLPQIGSHWRKVPFSAAGILLYIFFLESGGFLLCTFLFVLFYLKAIERVRWAGSLLFSISTVFATYFSFTYLLGVPLPQGIIPF